MRSSEVFDACRTGSSKPISFIRRRPKSSYERLHQPDRRGRFSFFSSSFFTTGTASSTALGFISVSSVPASAASSSGVLSDLVASISSEEVSALVGSGISKSVSTSGSSESVLAILGLALEPSLSLSTSVDSFVVRLRRRGRRRRLVVSSSLSSVSVSASGTLSVLSLEEPELADSSALFWISVSGSDFRRRRPPLRQRCVDQCPPWDP